jgi:hypothetical protein
MSELDLDVFAVIMFLIVQQWQIYGIAGAANAPALPHDERDSLGAQPVGQVLAAFVTAPFHQFGFVDQCLRHSNARDMLNYSTVLNVMVFSLNDAMFYVI